MDYYSLPEGKCTFVPKGVFHGPCLKFKGQEIEFRHHEQAELGLALHESGLRDTLSLPIERDLCVEVRTAWGDYIQSLKRTFEEEVAQRTPDEEKSEAAVAILLRRAVHG